MDLPSIQQLRNFVIYGKYGNFTTAANAANITQSAFSAQMKKLEDLVGVRLIERSNRGSHLTPAGKMFYTKIARILGELEEVLEQDCELAAFNNTAVNTIRVVTLICADDSVRIMQTI